MSGQFHEPEDSHHPQHTQYDPSDAQPSTRHPCPGHRHGDIVGCDGDHIDDVKGPTEEVPLVSGDQKAHYALSCEPTDAHGLHDPTEARGVGGNND